MLSICYLNLVPGLVGATVLSSVIIGIKVIDATESTDLTQQIGCVHNQLKHWASTESKHTQPHHTEEVHLKLMTGLLYRR